MKQEYLPRCCTSIDYRVWCSKNKGNKNSANSECTILRLFSVLSPAIF